MTPHSAVRAEGEERKEIEDFLFREVVEQSGGHRRNLTDPLRGDVALADRPPVVGVDRIVRQRQALIIFRDETAVHDDARSGGDGYIAVVLGDYF